MKKFQFFLVLTFLATAALAQRSTITGRVVDTLTVSLPSSTVMLLNATDSTLVNFAVTNQDGNFQIKGVQNGNYLLRVTFVGFEDYRLPVKIAGADVNTGYLKMIPKTRELDEIVIEGEKAPVTVKRDTIEFNAGSFKTKPNANVEDLLKKLPGVEVDNDGTVKAQGEEVQRVMVDGREFFGRDPKLATRNLPADAVDKVQVFDKKSDQAVFTGIDDGQREKTINLELKEEKRNGAFGTLMAGGGTADRYEGKASINKFSKTKQLSFLGMGNNTNEQGFSLDEYMNFTGGSRNMMGGGGTMRIQLNSDNLNGIPLSMGNNQNGITSNFAGGLNFNRDFTNNTKAGGSYFFNHTDQDVNTSLERINYLPSGNYLFNQNSRQKNLSDNQRVNLQLDHSIDSANSIKFTINAANSETTNTTFSQSETTDTNGVLQNESERTTRTDGSGYNLSSDFLYRHRFAKKGRSISANLTFGFNDFESTGNIGSLNSFYTGSSETRNILQDNTQSNEAFNYGVNASYTEPLGGRKYLEVNYNYRVNKNEVDRRVWDATGSQPVFDSLLSNQYSSQYTYNRPGINLRLIRRKFNLMVGAAWQNTTLAGDLRYQEVEINKTFENVLPVVRFNYDFSNFKHFRLDYETSMQEPTIQELQPVINNSDPLNISVGNPDLRPGYSHQIRGNFTMFDPASFISMFSFVTVDYTTNAISTSQRVDNNLVRTTQPVNVRDNMSVNASVHFGFPIKKIKSRFTVMSDITSQRGINLLNDVENTVRRQTVGGTVRYSYSLDEKVNIDLSTSVQQQRSVYDFDVADQLFLNKTYEAEANVKFLKNYQFNPNFRFLDYTSQTTGFSQTLPLLDISVSRFLLKNNSGELKFGVRNLLDRNISIVQTANTNYLEQRTSNNLGRFFMVTFTYALNKQLNPMNGRRGHMIRR